MKLKKINAILSLLTVLLLLAHIGIILYTYVTFDYRADQIKLFGGLLVAAMCLHAILGMCAVFLQGDGTRLDLYPRQNRRTVFQRVSAALVFPLLLLHLRNFDLLKAVAGGGNWFLFALLLAVQVLFYGVILGHTAVSVTRALITLGMLRSQETQKKLDRVIFVISVLIFLAVAFAVVRAQIIMFVH